MLKAESEKARDEWIKRTWNAVIAFTQTKKQQKRSKEKGEPWTWGEGRGRGGPVGLGRRRGKIAENRSSLYCLCCGQSVCV